MSNEQMMQELLEVFRVEAVELFDQLATQMARIGDQSGDDLRASARAAMRLSHNLKGSSSAVGLDALARLAHQLESALAPLCHADTQPPPSVADVLLAAVVTAQRLGESGESPELLREAQEIGPRLVEATAGLGGRVEATEAISHPTPTKPTGERAAARRQPSDEFALDQAAAAYVRVPTERLDALAGHLDELLAVQGQLGDQHETLRRTLAELEGLGAVSTAPWLEGFVAAHRKSHSTLSRLVSNVTATLQRIRTVPLASVAPQWRRVVRDCARSLGKDVQLQVRVGEAEIDKHVLDQLRDAMVHLLRNAVDHGIEPADERYLCGKPKSGTISLAAQMAGAHVLIEITDDGRGLEPDQVAQAAIARGLVSPEQVAGMSEEDKLDLVFRDGFSTAASVTAISGRGVGLAAVREDIARLQGSYAIESSGPGEGTTVRIRVPISVIATRGLLVRVNRTVYVLPIEAVERTLRTTGSRIRTIDGSPVLTLGERDTIPLMWMPGSDGARIPSDTTLDVVVLSFGVERVGLLVDEVIDEQECVTRRLPWNLQRVPGVNGVVVRHDGSVAVALDVQYLLNQAGRGRREPVVQDRAQDPSRPTRILVVDDALTSRTLARNILATAGYEVDAAVNGAQAWDYLQKNEFDLLVTDVQMPEMDGLELTRRVRSSSSLKDLPVILVTSRGCQSDIQLGAAAGADEYLVKGQFDHEKLLQAVERHLFAKGDAP